MRCARAGVVVPRVLWVDEKQGVLGMEGVRGWSVREVLGGGAEEEAVEEEEYADVDAETGVALEGLQIEVDSEGMRALRKVGVTQGTCRDLRK